MGDEEVEALRAISGLELGVRVLAWCRMTKTDIAAARRAGVGAVNLSIPASDRLLNAKLGVTREEALARVRQLVPFALDAGFEVAVGAEDASRADGDHLLRLADAAAEFGAFRLRIADTVGALDPFATHALVTRVAAASDLAIEFHGHNDYGLATANSLAAARAGATHLSVTVGGLGERAGNAPLEEVAAALECLHGEATGSRSDAIIRAGGDGRRSGATQRPDRQGDRRHRRLFPRIGRSRRRIAGRSRELSRSRSGAVWSARPLRRRQTIGREIARPRAPRAWHRLAEETAPLLVALVRRRATQSKTALSSDELARLHQEAVAEALSQNIRAAE